jgi:hypothetical protein
MRKLARVWNLDEKIYTERFREKDIVIEPKRFIVMDPSEAETLLKTYTPIIKDGAEKHLKMKMLKMEVFNAKGQDAPKTEAPKHVCPVDGQDFPTQKLYNDHVRENHMDSIVDKESKETFEEELQEGL